MKGMILFLFVTHLSSVSAAEIKKLSLDDSIRIALKEATSVLKATRDNQLSGTQLLQGYFQFLPSVVAQGAYNYSKGTTYFYQAAPTLVRGSNYGPSYQITATLNIFNGLNDFGALKSALNRRDAADKTLTRAKQQISLDIAQSFLQVILDQKLIEIADKNLKTSRERQELLEEQTKVGVRNLADLFRQQAQTSADESFAINQQNKKKTDLILFLRKLRIDPNEPYELVEPPLESQAQKFKEKIPDIPDDQALIKKAFEAREDYHVSELSSQAAHWDVVAARSTFLPHLDFVASYGAAARNLQSQLVAPLGQAFVNDTPTNQTSFNSQLTHQTAYTYGVVLTWNIFDRWLTGYNVEKAKAVAFKSDLDKDDFKRQVAGEVKQAVNDFQTAIQQMIATDKGVVAARKAYEVSQGRYEVGALNFIDLSTAQVALVQAEATRAQALISYELQKRVIDFAVGTTPVEL